MNSQIELQQLLKQAWHFFEKKNIEKSVQCSQALNNQFPRSGEGWFYTYRLAAALNNLQAALEALKHATELTPDNLYWQFSYAKVLLNQGMLALAFAQANKLKKYKLNADQLSQLAHIYFSLDLANDALDLYKQASEVTPDDGSLHYNIAAIQRHLGFLEEAKVSLNRAIEHNPSDVDAIVLLAELTKQTEQHNLDDKIQTVFKSELSPKQKVQLHFALAKGYEDRQDYGSCFAQLELGNNLRRQHLNYHVEHDVQTLTDIQHHYNETWWKSTENSDEQTIPFTPIFILGMPRTGSTLIDRILSNHDLVYSAGELSEFTQVLTKLVNSSAKITNKSEFLQASKEVDLAKLGSLYIEQVTQRIGLQGHQANPKFVIDKLPFNFLYIALIKKALPNAVIIHSKRDPMDTCLAIYKTLFDQAYPFAYKQQELAKYFLAYQNLMAHWQALNIPILEVNYEELVREPNKVGAFIYQALDLEWQASFSDMATNKSMVNTASSSQVRQKIHTKSVGNWCNFENNLNEIKSLLKQAESNS